MASERMVYRIHGMYWQQQALNYGQLVELYKLLKGRFAGFAWTSPQLGAWLDKLIEDDLAPRAVAVVLTPYEPTPLHRAWNRWMAKRNGINTPQDLAKVITLSPRFARVVRDFFFLNVAWLEGWLNMPLRSGTELGNMSPMQIVQSLTRVSMTLAEATSVRREPSSSSPP